MPEPEKLKSLLYALTGILFVLVLLDKSLGGTTDSPANPGEKTGFFSRFNTIGKSEPVSPSSTQGSSHTQRMDRAEDEILSELMGNSDYSENEMESNSLSEDSDPEDVFIPVVENPKSNVLVTEKDSSFVNPNKAEHLKTGPEEAKLYFLKFYGKGTKSHSRLVLVNRKIGGGDKVLNLLKELGKGPLPEERKQGVLNALPQRFSYSTDYSMENGILKISLGSEFETGAGPEILKDRVDQLCYTILDNIPVKGIRLFINGKIVRSLGGDGYPIPAVLTKSPRKIAIL
ncbi:spore gernimation protein [Leptospira perolatii]|uniref:Spore gernimation protein n=1 Tax=Leptospira perolatii TaxID=2023191 RepID=A0A2M9ZPW5_9LEPT|nr:GerMN domain-containing protein [Leptospira perolatii]PJZ69011.1 spore gernimation protein [Leptospira perolatii]PJZ74120.1 spore gernimation protein [Leptospira perolatii]